MELNYLLSAKGIDTTKRRQVLVMRHVPQEPELRKALPWLAAERPEVFNAYQQTQRPMVEKRLTQAAYLVSCIGIRGKPKEALFVGVYRVNGNKPLSVEKLLKTPANQTLQELGGKEFFGAASDTVLWFNLELLENTYQEWKGKLILGWPPPPIAWAQWLDPEKRNKFPIKAILEESILDKTMPPWNELILTWHELKNLPTLWINRLSQWRAIYFILDAADGKGYVGSTYGEKNLYGRWENYADSGDAGNKLLRKPRKPDKFRFSILQRVSPDMEPKDIINLEGNWKDRLHTRIPFGLNIN